MVDYFQYPTACDKFSVITQTSSPQSSVASIVLRRNLDYAESNFYQIRLIADVSRKYQFMDLQVFYIDANENTYGLNFIVLSYRYNFSV